MKNIFSLKTIAFLTVIIFSWNQVVWADGIQPVQPYDLNTSQPTMQATTPNTTMAPETLSTSETTQVFLTDNSPLSQATPEFQEGQGGGGELLQTEATTDGKTIFHVYENEWIQDAINGAAAGDTIFLHAGIYNQSVVLNQGINLKGEDSATVILDGQGMFRDVILAQGDNLIEGITVKGGAPYSGPKSAVRIEGSNVILRNSRVVDNADYGVYLRSGNNILIERVFFQNNHLAIQHPSTAATNAVIRYSTFVNNGIGINILGGVTPRIENNIMAASSFCAIYEFSWSAYASGQLSRGFAVLKNNVFYSNAWTRTAYGSSTPPEVENLTSGNMTADPQFNGDYSIPETSPAYGKGSILPPGLDAALDRVELIGVDYSITPILDNGTVTGYRVLYEEGSVEEFYNDGRQVLDTTPPEITFSSENIFVNQTEYDLVYWIDGVVKSEQRHLSDGENHFDIHASDIFGNQARQTIHVTLDQTLPTGTLEINDGDEETNSGTVVLSIGAHDNALLKEVRFSLDGGNSWTAWEEYSPAKVVTLSGGDGTKEVICELRDAAGNSVSFSDAIRFVTTPVLPVIQFLSPSVTADPVYLFRYSVNGIEHQETWQLQPGENRLMVSASFGVFPVIVDYVVTLNQTAGALPPIPALSSLPPNLNSVKAANGLILKYYYGSLVAIEKTGDYTLFNIELDAQKNLTGGVLLFQNGDRLLYQEGNPVYRLTPSGEKTVYNEDGSVAYVLTADNKKIYFAYQRDASGKILSVLSFEETVTSFYDAKGRPVCIKKIDGTTLLYQDGFLSSYTDAVGNIFHYEFSILHEGNQLTGYRSELVSVALAGTSSTIPIATVLSDLASYPAVQTTFENEISRLIEYDPSGSMKTVVSGKGETLQLDHQLPVGFTSSSGESYQFQNTLDQSNSFLSVALTREDLEQVFDAQGKLTGIRLSDGMLLQIKDLALDKITLEDGSVLTKFSWDIWGSNKLTGFTRTYADGSEDVYLNSSVISHTDAAGNVTRFVNQDPGSIFTSDGRTYRVTESKNAQGQTERLTELLSIQLDDGSWVEFQYGKPVRYVRNKYTPLDPTEVPVALDGKFFIPLIELPNAQLRELTVDQNGSIFSGQILFNDGTQYLIENNKIVTQITATGQFVKVSGEPLPAFVPQPFVKPEPLTVEETTYRDQLVETQLDYFMDGKGIHAGTGLPVDHYKSSGNQQSDYSQATLVGFWAEILSSVAAGDYTTSKLSREQAFLKLKNLLETYREVQRQAGWNGMVAFFTIVEKQEPVLDGFGDPTGQTQTVYEYINCFNQVGFGDVLNLSVSLSSVIGALESLSLQDAALAGYRDQILSDANAILTAQEAGYAAFYDPEGKRFHGACSFNVSNGKWEFVNNYYIDRVFNEFRTGMIWLASKYPQYADALTNLEVAVRPYETQQGKTIDLAVPYDGGAFQMFWPLMHVDETQYPEFEVALRNFLYAQAEFASAHDLPGLLSAGDMPFQGYQGKIGLPDAAETDDALFTDIGSIYGTASAFPLAPHYTLQYLKNLQIQFPGMVTGAGFVDAVQMKTVTVEDPQTGETTTTPQPVYSNQYYGVDQASLILSLLKTSQNYFGKYLQNTGVKETFDSIYRSFMLNLNPITQNNPNPPAFDQNASLLYNGTSLSPDGISSGLIKQPAFVSTIFDLELGEGRVFNYLTPTGNFHHIEIEFGSESNPRRMNLQEYFLNPKHAGAATALLGGLQLDVLNSSISQGVFFTPNRGLSKSAFTMDPEIGAVRHLNFQFLSPWSPVGIWANYNHADLSAYDFLSMPVKLAPGTPQNVRLKIEFKGMGEVFITEPLGYDWQYVSIPIPKAAGDIHQIAISIQPLDGKPVTGDLYLGPLSAVKVRTSNEIDWKLLIGKTEAEMRTLIQKKIGAQVNGGQGYATQEVLENFTIDSSGKLVSGVLRRADGGIQFFQNGQLVKWVFRNGRTILFENGLATFVVDLSRGKLETGRFYYDQSFSGKIYSFIVQDNESKKIFGPNGELKTLVEEGYFVNYDQGKINSIVTDRGTLTQLQFADDGSLLKAHAALSDGTQFDIDQTELQMTEMGGGVKLYYDGRHISAIETPQNGRTEFNYLMDVNGHIVQGDARFWETVRDPQTGENKTVVRNMSLFEYLARPERAIEKTYLLREASPNLLTQANVGGFYTGEVLPSGETTKGSKDNCPLGVAACYEFLYQGTSAVSLGMYVSHPSQANNINSHHFLTVTLKQDPSMDWNQRVTLKLKSASYEEICSFEINNLTGEYQTFAFPVSDKIGFEGEITLEVDRQSEGFGKAGKIYLKDISYASVSLLEHPLWEDRTGISAAAIQRLNIESNQLTSVGEQIASGIPLVYVGLAAKLDTPTLLHYVETAPGNNQLVNFNKFDGTQVQLEGENVSRIVLPDGTVNDYAATQNSSSGTIQGPTSDPGDSSQIQYSYGALRKITQPDGREYLLSYEFDANGKEITIFKDVVSGEERRFKDGKLLSADNSNGLQTQYSYKDGELIGAELAYRNRVLNSTTYTFRNNQILVTDDRGTTWFYDNNGNLLRHLTKDGYLYEYSEYTQSPVPGMETSANDFKNALFTSTGLRSVNLIGYEAADGSRILYDYRREGKGEIHLMAGDQGVNLMFDSDQKIKSGQIQFANGHLLEIENYIPVRGRLASGASFDIPLPQAESFDIFQDSGGIYTGFRLEVHGLFFTYDTLGRLKSAESETGISHSFNYVLNSQGQVTGYTHVEKDQIAFNGVPFPKEVTLTSGTSEKLFDASGKEIATHDGNGFLVGVYRASTDQWDIYSGSFASEGDRLGLEHFLSEIKAGDSVAAVVSDPSFSLIDEATLELFEGLGAGNIRQAASASNSWSFFGNESLSKGQGAEKLGESSFSTITTTIQTIACSSGSAPQFENVSMLLSIPAEVGDAYSLFLRKYETLKAPRDMQSVTVYNEKSEIMYTRRLDGMNSYYEFGKVRETYDTNGDLVVVHEYACPAGGCKTSEDAVLKSITLVKARRDFEAEAAKLREQIEQAKFDALYRLAWQDDVARKQIKENVDMGVSQINSQIASLQDQRFRKVKECHRVFFWKECSEHTYEVPGVQDAINQLAAQRAELVRTGREQLAAIPGVMAAKRDEIEQATAEKTRELALKKQEFLLDILHQEMDPIVKDFYRTTLGRDPSKQEFDQWVNRFKEAERIDIQVLRTELQNSAEKTLRETQKATILQGLRDFLADYFAATSEVKTQMLQSLSMTQADVVELDSADTAKILEWLESRDLHFGQSAFLSLKEMLASKGANISMEVIGKEAILIDILAGVINRFTEGDLVISMFALDRTAAIHEKDFAAVKFTYEDLRAMYQMICSSQAETCGLRVIAHIAEDHFVVIKKVTDTEVTYKETGKGTNGEDVTVTKDQFLKVWIAKENAGYLMVAAEQANADKKLSDPDAMKIRGSFFGIDDLIFWSLVISLTLTAGSIVVSYFSPTFGQILGYAALVAGIVGIVASLGNFIVQGIKMAFSTLSQQSIFTTIKQGLTYLGKIIMEPVRFVGRFIENGFAFLKNGFTGGFGDFGSGIMGMKDFLLKGAGAEIYKDGVLVGQEFTFAQVAARGLVAATLNMSVSAGLEGLGLDPALARLGGAFVGGGFLGIGSLSSSFLKSGLQMMMMQGVSEMAAKIGLPPPIADALSLIGNTALGSFFDGSFQIKDFTNIIPTVASKLTMGGMELIGRSMGLDPRIAQLIGLPLSAITGSIVGNLIGTNPSITGPNGIFGLIKDAFLSRETLGGIISLSAEFLIDQLDLDESLLGSFSARIIGGLFGDFIASPSQFSIVDSIIKSLDESIYHFFDPVMLPQLFGLILDNGFSEGIESYAISLFTRETLQEFTGAGESLSQWIERGIPTAEDIIYEGESAKLLKLERNGKSINFIFVPKGARLEIRAIYEQYDNGRRPRCISWETNDSGTITKVLVTEQLPDGTFRVDELDPNGRIREAAFRDWDGEIYGSLSFNSSGGIEFTNYNLGVSNYLTANGEFTFDFSVAPDLQDLNQLVYDFNTNLSPDDVAQLVGFTFGNGFWNSQQSADSVSTLMAKFIGDLVNDQAGNGTPGVVLFDANGNIARDRHGNILTTGSLPITLYEETGLVGNVLRWVANTWFGSTFMRDEIESELIRYFDLIALNQQEFELDPNMRFVHFAHSGNFQPMIHALEHMPDEYRSKIKTLVVYEGPYAGDGVINDPYLETLVRVRGVKPGLEVPMIEHRNFQVVDQNGNVLPLQNQYNIEVISAGHLDFSYDPSFNYSSPVEAEIARKTSLFMRDLSLKAGVSDPQVLRDFLSSMTAGVSVQLNANSGEKTIKVDPLTYQSPFGDRN